MNHFGILALALALCFPAYLHAASQTPDHPRAQQVPQQETKKRQGQSPRRRSVPAISPETLPAPTTSTQAVISRPPATVIAPPAKSAQPDRPSPVTGCDAGGCWDAGGNRYNSGAGNTYLNNAGQLCTRNGAWMQCF